jgi:hypothetical protein
MPKIFISYRREDSQYVADNVYEHMVKHFGGGNVFLDVGSIPFGLDFRQYLHDQVAAHDAMLALIGPDWARIMRERAGEPNDFVRIEIEHALQLEKLVIPTLVMGAALPSFADLPESIQDLQWHQSIQIRRHPDLAGDCARLADSIKQVCAVGTAEIRAPHGLGKASDRGTAMSISWANYEFEGTYSDTASLRNRSGTYVILTTTLDLRTILDVGESSDVKYRVENHERADCWRKHANGKPIQYAVRYAPDGDRQRIEQAVRQRHNPPCGER